MFIVPFYANTPDDSRCVPAVFRMVMKYFWPEKKFGWKEADELVGHVEGKGTWFFPAFVKMRRMGFEVEYLDMFDYGRFYDEGEKYLLERQKGDRKKVGWYLRKSDLLEKRELIPGFVVSGIQKKLVPEIKDVEKYLMQGWLVACDVNACVLNNLDGYSPHYVLVVGVDEEQFWIHDPGLPPYQNRGVSKAKFFKAWSFDGDARSLAAFRYGIVAK